MKEDTLRYGIFCFLLFIASFFVCSAQQEKVRNVFDKVVIDAGHGGDKPGAIGSKYKEKDVTLAVAIKLGKLINENLKTVKVYYTRVIDQDIDLYKRSSVANKINADLFLSIHCNSATNKNAAGTETYAMGLGKTESNLEVAKKEHAEVTVIGNGSNLLVGDKGIRGLVIEIGSGMNDIRVEDTKIVAGAGALLSKVANAAVAAGLGGMEFAAGIPGSIGGAVTMNAGAYGGEMKDILESVKVIDPEGMMHTLSVEALDLSYRHS